MYFLELIAICIALVVMRHFLTPVHSDAGSENLDLAPVEIAYLSRDGDTTFALSVLTFDMLHRELKARLPTSSQNLELPAIAAGQGHYYESRLKEIIKSSLKNWGQNKVDQAGLNIKKDPVAFIRRLPLLYRLLSAALKGTAHEVLKDPRHLRKYISKTGLIRIMAEIGSSGFKQQFEDELKTELLAKGLLLEANQRKKLALVNVGCFVIAELAFIILLLQAIPDHSHSLIIYVLSALTAFSVKTAIGARSFIPLYEDLHEVLRHAPRNNIRLTALKIFLQIINLLLNGLSIVIFLFLLLIGSAVLYLTHTVTSSSTYFMLLSMMLAQYIAAGYLLEAYRLRLSESTSPLAQRHIKLLKARYRESSSIDALKSLLLTSQYDPQLSYLLAIFGIETLFFI